MVVSWGSNDAALIESLLSEITLQPFPSELLCGTKELKKSSSPALAHPPEERHMHSGDPHSKKDCKREEE